MVRKISNLVTAKTLQRISLKAKVLVKVLRSGICNTDIELLKGYLPFTGVLGHEFVGEVVDTTSDLNGKRVVGEINCVCHECRFCRNGMKRHCSNRTVMGMSTDPELMRNT